MLEYPATLLVLGSAFCLALVLGATMAGTRYCTLGAVSDWVNIGDTRRAWAWGLAMGTALVGTSLLTRYAAFDPGVALVPYTSPLFAWPRYGLGGLLFGIGMSLAGGCSSRTLIRIGGGSTKAIVILSATALTAYLLIKQAWYVTLIEPLLAPVFIDLSRFGVSDQRLGSLLVPVFSTNVAGLNTGFGFALGLGLIIFALLHPRVRASPIYWLGGVTVGLVVTGGWYLTGSHWGEAWIQEVSFFADSLPPNLGVQSYSTIGPLADLMSLLLGGGRYRLLSFGLCGAAGLLCGSLVYHLATGRWQSEWFPSWADFRRNLAGGVLLGLGGVLAMGCSLGQGVTGVSTVACGSLLATGGMVLGAALSMKVELYRMVYVERAGWLQAVVAALADLHMLPQRWRRLDPV